MEKIDKLKMFSNELNYIKDNNLRKFAEEIIGNADDYFFVVPASSSGKYHPQFSLGNNGLVRHTRCVAYFAMSAGESYNFDQYTIDLLIIGALAHDIKKQGDGTSSHTVREHPLLAAQYIIDMQKNFSKLISEENAEKIAGAIRCHMGKWEGTKEWVKGGKTLFPMPKNEFEQALQLADYFASRKKILDFDFDVTEEVDTSNIIIENTKTNNIDINSLSIDELSETYINFGKHKGKQFKDVLESGYLKWMTTQETFFNEEIQSKAKRYLLLLNKDCGDYPVNVKINENEKQENNSEMNLCNDDDLPF